MTGIKEIKTAEQILNKFKSFSIEVHKFDFEQGYIKEDVLAAMEEYKSQWDESKEETEKIIMKNIPKKIYLHVDSDHEPTNNFDALDVDLVYWTSKRQEESDIEYNLVEGDAVEKEQEEGVVNVSWEDYDNAINQIGQLQEQLKEAEREIRDLQRRDY